MQEQQPTDQQVAAILLANGLEDGKNEPNEQYVQRLQEWLRNNGNLLSAHQIDYIRTNIVSIREKIHEKVKVRNVLCGLGHFSKWAYTLGKCITNAKGWNQLVAKTAAYGPSQIAKRSLIRTLGSRSMWWVTGIIATIEVGIQAKKWYKNQITAKQFFINSGKILIVNATSVAGGAGGAYAGAAVGMACGGPVGAIIGAIVGGISGSLVTSYGTQKLLEYADTKYQQYTAQKLIDQALDFFQLPSRCSLQTLENLRKAKFMHYHPDKWQDSPNKKQQEMAIKLQKTMEYYEILKNAIEACFENKRPQALKFFQLYEGYSQADLENAYKRKVSFYDSRNWTSQSSNKQQAQIAGKSQKTKLYYQVLKKEGQSSFQIRLSIEN